MESISYAINVAAHQQRLRAELEGLRRRGPQLPHIEYHIERGAIATCVRRGGLLLHID
jgi:hypothetical protein